MSLPLPATKSNSDSALDDPEQALLVDLAGAVDKVNEVLDHLGESLITATPLKVGNGLQESAGFLVIKPDGSTLVVSANGIKLADDVVDLQHLKHRSAGGLPYYAGSGVPAELPLGGAEQVLGIAAGLPAWIDAPGGGWEFVSSADWVSGASISVSLGSTPEVVRRLEFKGLHASHDATLSLDFSDDSGATWLTGKIQYGWSKAAASAVSASAISSADAIPLTTSTVVEGSNPETYALSGIVEIYDGQEGEVSPFNWAVSFRAFPSPVTTVMGHGIVRHAAALTDARLTWSTGTAAGGTLRLREMSWPRS